MDTFPHGPTQLDWERNTRPDGQRLNTGLAGVNVVEELLWTWIDALHSHTIADVLADPSLTEYLKEKP